ncbi:MAG: hypothetical protein ACRD01_02530 [Terriglobales bacterium]
MHEWWRIRCAGTLSSYGAVYFEGDNGDDGGPSGVTAIGAAGASTAVSAYLAGGGTVMIEDYAGESAWDAVVGTTSGAPSGDVAGYNGTTGTDVCSDGETVTATGTTNGFTQPPALGCWEHQAYNESYFSTLGFSKSFYDAGPDLVGGATTGWSGLLSSGETLTGSATPEPPSYLLFGGGTLLLVLGGAFFGKRFGLAAA